MTEARTRGTARRLVLELVVVGVLAGTGATFPRGATADAAWSFLVHDLGLLAHATVGVLVLVDAALLAARVAGEGTGVVPVAGLAGLLGVAASVAAGVAYVGGGQHDTALSTMTGGWVLALLAYAVVWRVAGRAARMQPPGARVRPHQ